MITTSSRTLTPASMATDGTIPQPGATSKSPDRTPLNVGGDTPKRHFSSTNWSTSNFSKRVESRREDIEIAALYTTKTSSLSNPVVQKTSVSRELEIHPPASRSRVSSRLRDLQHDEISPVAQMVVPVHHVTAAPEISGSALERHRVTPARATPRSALPRGVSRRDGSKGQRIAGSAPNVRNVAATAIMWKETPRTPGTASMVRYAASAIRRRTSPRVAPSVSRVRNVAASAIIWRKSPSSEPIVNRPQKTAPIFPTSKLGSAKTYKTKDRSMLPELSQQSVANVQGLGHQGRGVVAAEFHQSKLAYDLEPTTSSFEFPGIKSPKSRSQESLSLEQKLRRGHETSAEEVGDPFVQQVEEFYPEEEQEEVLGRENDMESEKEDENQEEGQEEGQEEEEQVSNRRKVLEVDQEEYEEEQKEEQEQEEEEEQNIRSHIGDDESLSDTEKQLLEMGGSYGKNPSTSASSSPKRPRSASGYDSDEDEKQNDGEGDENSQVPIKKRRTERRVPSAEIRKAALQELNESRASKATRKTTVTCPTKKPTKPSNFERPRKEKPVKQPRRLPDHGELILVRERLNDSDIDGADTPPLELSQDPISQISDGEKEEESSRNRGGSKTTKIKKPKGFGKIDVSLFRIPSRAHLPIRLAKIDSYSDGFSGKERVPIGHLMPVKLPSRRKQSCHHASVKYKELTLVSERPSEPTPESVRQLIKKSRKSKKAITRITRAEQNDENMLMDMLMDKQNPHTDHVVKFVEWKDVIPKPQTPMLADQSLLSSTPVGKSSPLKRKSLSFLQDLRNIQHSSLKSKSQPIINVQTQEESLPRPPSTIPILRKTKKQILDDQIASEEISQVTMKRTKHQDNEAHEQPAVADWSSAVADPQDLDNRSEAGGDQDSLSVPSEDENNENEHEAREKDEFVDGLEAGAEEALDENSVHLAEEDNDPGSIVDGVSALELHDHSSKQASFGEQNRPIDVTILQSDLRLFDSLLLEIHQQTESAKVRLQEKRQTPRSSQSMRPEYTSLIHAKDVYPNQPARETPKLTTDASNTKTRKRQQSQMDTIKYDSPWRPRIPDTRGPGMQVDEEIVDVPTPPKQRQKSALFRRKSVERRSSTRSLYVVDELPESRSFETHPVINDSQEGSIILGNTQNFHHTLPVDIHETQVEVEEEEDAEENLVIMVPERGYFSQASQNLSQPHQRVKSNISRTASTTVRARVHFDQNQEEDGQGLMAGGISMSAAFQHTVSPSKSSSGQRQPSQNRISSQPRTPSQNKSLRDLTRTSSIELGTLHGSARRRTVSLKFTPPFIKPLQT